MSEDKPSYVPGLAGVPVTESSISYVDGKQGHLEYRGIDIETLAENSSFEEVTYLLLYGKLPTQQELDELDKELRSHRRLKYRIIDMIKCFPDSTHPMEALQSTVAALGMFYLSRDADRTCNTPQASRDACVRLIAKMPTIVAAHARLRNGDEPVAPRDDLNHASNFLYMLTGIEPDPLMAKIMDVALIVHAEHTLNASTFSAMVTASTLADPYTVISSAVGTLSGPLHGGANEEVLDMLDEIGSYDRAEAYLNEKLVNKQKITGLGHRIYKTKDPRATLLQRLYDELAEKHGADPTYEIAKHIEELSQGTLGAKGVCPNVDFYSGIVYRKMGIEHDLFTPIFAIARVTGWLAHWLEQLGKSRIYRPMQIYVGGHGEQYIPIDQR